MSNKLILVLSILGVLLAGVLGLHAQENPDIEMLLGEFEKKASALTANRVMDALYEEQFIDAPTLFTEEMPLDSMRQQVYYWTAEWLYDKQKYEEARNVALQALPLFHASNESRADCLNLLGLVYVRLGDFDNAANYAKQCLAMDMKSGDDDLISSSMNTVAGIYMAGNQAQAAEKYILGALDHSQKVDNPQRRAVLLGMASEVYHKLGNDEKALAFAEQAYSIDSLLGRSPQAAIRLSQKASALLGLHRYDEAEQVSLQALPALKEAGNYHSYAIALNGMGMALLCQERPEEAILYYKEAESIFSNMGDLYNQIHSHRGLYESYWKINPDSAKIELERFNELKDSLYSHSTAAALSRYNAEFGNDLLQKENSAMRQDNRRNLIIAAAILLAFLLAAWLVVYYMRRGYQLRMRRLMAEIEKLQHAKPRKPEPVAEKPAERVPVTVQARESEEDDKQFLISVIGEVNASIETGNISVEQIASALNIGEQSFRRKLMALTGETPKAFFTAIQMERAVDLLRENPDMQVSKVAQLCGFENVSSFNHTFKRMYNCSPSQYRRK